MKKKIKIAILDKLYNYYCMDDIFLFDKNDSDVTIYRDIYDYIEEHDGINAFNTLLAFIEDKVDIYEYLTWLNDDGYQLILVDELIDMIEEETLPLWIMERLEDWAI